MYSAALVSDQCASVRISVQCSNGMYESQHCLVVFVLYNCAGGESMGTASGPIPMEPIQP
jgi:hypothetical protein